VVDTLLETVPEGPAPEPASTRRRLGWPRTVGLSLVAVTSIGLGAAALVPTPDYRIAPGETSPVADLIEAEDATLYPPEGEVLFTTVRIGPMSWLERWWNERDGDVDIVPEEAILGTRSREENREENLRVMGASKDTATYVALNRLGYDVSVTNGGVLVVEVGAEYPAAGTLQPGDLITAVDGTTVQLPDDLRNALTGSAPGDTVSLTVTRGDVTEDLEVELGAGDDGRAIVGIAPDIPDTVQFTFPFPVTIDSGRTGGPSAGLAFTLTLLDELTPGELTGGKRVAATGAIDVYGNVLPVGGVRQKAVTVREAGADLFLVPADLVDEALRGAGDVRVVGVNTLDEALTVLAELGGNALELGTPGADA
jgi:Lon-like protease